MVRDGPDQCLVEEDSYNPPIDEACTPVDITFLAIRSIRISSTNFSTTLCSPNIHTHGQITQVRKQILKVIKSMVMSRQHSIVHNHFSISSNISIFKSGPRASFKGINKQHCNGFLQRVKMP
jgi:hypothetical protein